MAIPSSVTSLNEVLHTVQSNAQHIKGQAENAIVSLNGTVNTEFIFIVLDRLRGFITTLNTWKNTTGLDTYATDNLPGYGNSLVSDIDVSIAAAQACIDWVVANFPTGTGGHILSHVLNADGTRTPRTFSSAQTSGLRTLLQTLTNSIG